MTTREPEWDEQERAWMLALAAYEDDELCPVCGGPKVICQAPENEFEVPPPSRCKVATAIAEARKPYGEKAKHPQALTFGARLKR